MTRFSKRTLPLLLAVLLLLAGACSAPSATGGDGGLIKLRGVWVATVYNLDYPSKGTADADALKRQADQILETSAGLGINAVFLQVRPSCDALYPSELFPWSRYLTGASGTAPAGGFDPLAYWVEKAHALGLELHAWINPFRITKGGRTELDALDPGSPAKTHPEWVVEYDGNYYLDPGLPQVRELVIQGAEELARSYAVDGIHLDDYFYPGSSFADDETFRQYGGGFSDRGDWRRDNVNQLVRELGERLHAMEPELSYGISPTGVWADSRHLSGGSATTGGFESYFASYADSRKWVQEGWVDYICPQIYWPIGSKTMDYETIARWWSDMVRGTGVELYVGMADYKAEEASETSVWHGTQAIRDQLSLNRTLPEVTGELHFRYQFLAKSAALTELYTDLYGREGAPEPTPSPSPSPTPEGGRPLLNRTDHSAYLQGSGGLFRPDAPLTRGEATALFARLSVDESLSPLYDGSAYTGGFTDVEPEDWHAPYIAFAQRYRLISGYPDGTFRPDRHVTRAEFAQLLSGFFDLPEAGPSPFADLDAGHWAARAVFFAAAQGWLSGYPDGTFRPEQGVTRAEAVKLLNGALGRSADRDFIDQVNAINPFSDLTAEHWAYYEILEASRSHTYESSSGGEVWSALLP